MENKYYCLVAGLPDISLEDNKLKVSLTEMKEELEQSLLPTDMELIRLFFLKFDNQNLLNILLNKEEVSFNQLGNISADDLGELIKQVKDEGSAGENKYPQYMQEFLASYFAEDQEDSEYILTKQLVNSYFQYAQSTTNDFVSGYFEFEQNLWNVITAINCRKFEITAEKEIIGNNEISKLLRKSSAKDFGLANEFELVEKLLQISEEPNLKEREKQVDAIRWEVLEDSTFFNFFTIEKIYAYLVKLEILERWTSLDDAQGQEEFNNIIKTLESSYEVPAEF